MKRENERCDVVIVGGRVAGAATALLLAREGLSVVLLERAHRGADTLSTHAFMRGGVVLLRSWGLLDQIIAAGTPPVRQTLFHYSDGSSRISIKAAAGVDALYAPRRTVLDTLLTDAAAAAGAQVRFGVTVTDLVRDHDGRVTGVIGRDRTGEPVSVTARLTVGADGVRSTVARAANARTIHAGTAAGAVAYGYWQDLDVTGYEWFYRPGVTAGFIPTNDGRVCVFAGIPADQFDDQLRGDVKSGYLRLLQRATRGAQGRLVSAVTPGQVRAYPGRAGFARQAWGNGWALVGDAGHFLDPLSTHGMTDAMRDAVLLAHAVKDAARGRPVGEALGWYQDRRDEMAAPISSIVDQICSYTWDSPGIRRLLLSLSSVMSDEVEALLRFDL